MFNFKIIKTISKILNLRNLNISILKYSKIEKNKIFITDMNNYIVIDYECDKWSGIIDPEIFGDTSDIKRSSIKIQDEKFPVFPDIENEISVPINLLDTKKLQSFEKYTLKDEKRIVLNGIFFDPLGFMVCTDGKTLMVEKCNKNELENGFIFPSKSINLLKVISLINPIIKASVGFINNDMYLHILGKNYSVKIKLINETYPDYKKLIPKSNSTTTKVTLTEKNNSKLKEILKLLSYTDEIVIFSGNRIESINKDIDKYCFKNMNFTLSPKDLKIGFEIKNLLQVLNDFPIGGDISFQDSNYSPIKIQKNNLLCLVSPVKFSDEYFENYDKLNWIEIKNPINLTETKINNFFE